MSISRIRAFFVLVVVGIAFSLYLSCDLLPDRVAANFGKGGRVVTYNERDSYRVAFITFALILPAIVYFAIGWLPRVTDKLLFLPRRAYWLSPERRLATLTWIEKFGLATGVLVSVFWFGLHMVNFRASLLDPPHYESWPRTMLLLGWLIFILGAGFIYRRRFSLAA